MDMHNGNHEQKQNWPQNWPGAVTTILGLLIMAGCFLGCLYILFAK